MNKRQFFYSIPVILLLIVAVAGWFATDSLGNKARQEIIGESQASALTLSIHVSSTLNTLKGAVKSLAGSPWIASALLSKGAQDIEHANSVLDRYNSALNASVSYLMDADGMTVASSNRNDPDSFMGKSYRFRPYFQEAAKGQPYHYFALGITSGKRGFYASYPVQNRIGNVVGVVTMKKDLDEMETFFSKYVSCSLISPDGIIFFSSTPSMVLKSLWPLDKAVQEKIIASRQFGNKPFEAVIKKEFADGTEVTLEGNAYFVSRKVIDSDGWSIVLLAPADRIRIYKLIGILATVSVGFLILVFSGIIYVTDRSKEAIRQSEEKLKLLFDSAGDAMFVIDVEARMLAVNRLACERFGYTHAELMSMTIDQVDSPAEAQHVPDRMTRLMEHGHLTFETVQQRKDGSLIPTDVIARRITWDGQPAFMSICRDITERKRAEEKLRESEEEQRLERDRLELILKTAQDGFWLVDVSTGHLVDVNEAASSMLGYTREELLKRGLADIDAQWSPEEIGPEVEKIKTAGNMFFETRHRAKNGQIIDVEVSVNYLPATNQFFSFIRDITKRKRAEKALQENEEKFRTLFDRASDGILIADPITKKFLQGNAAICSMLGYTEEEIKSLTIYDIHPPKDESLVSDEFEKQIKGEKALAENMPLLRKDGLIIYADIGTTHVIIEGTDYLMGTFRDITERKQAEAVLLESEEKQRLERGRLDLILKTAQDGFWLVDASTGHLVDVNEAASSMLGYTREELLKRGLADIDAQWSPEEIGPEVEKIKTAGNMFFETRHRAKDGQIIDVEISVNYLPATDQFFSFIRNITERKKMEGTLKQNIERFRDLVETTSDVIWEIDQDGVYTYINLKIKDLLGYDPSEVIGRKTPFDMMLPEERIRLEEAFSAIVKDRKAFANLENWNLRKDGRKVLLETGGVPFYDAEGQYAGYRGIDRDITERKQTEERIQQMAYHDSLTGLPNRKLFSDRLGIALIHAQRNQKKTGVAMLDLDNFKDVNDTLGHAVGDLLLKATAERLKAALRKGDTVARFGGDEFVLILPELKVVEDAIKVAQKIVDSFRKPFLIDTHKLVVTTSIGIAVCPDDGTDEGVLLKNADIAMYQAKQAGRDRYQLYKEA